jgi:hypothetical protein
MGETVLLGKEGVSSDAMFHPFDSPFQILIPSLRPLRPIPLLCGRHPHSASFRKEQYKFEILKPTRH